MAGELGIEPRATGSKPVMLPLHHTPTEFGGATLAYEATEQRRARCHSSSSHPEQCTSLVPCAKDGGPDGSRTRLNLVDSEVPDR